MVTKFNAPAGYCFDKVEDRKLETVLSEISEVSPWPLKSTAALLDKVPAGAIDEAFTDTVLSVVTDVH